MFSRTSTSRAAVLGSQIGKLAECDASLSAIATDVTGLRDELAQLRADAAELARLLSERDETLRRLERDHEDAVQRTSTAAASLSEAEEELSARREEVATLERERGLLNSRIDEAQRSLTDAAADRHSLQDALAERERTIEELREQVRHAEAERTSWQERSAALAGELASSSAEKAHLTAALVQQREREPETGEQRAARDESQAAGHLRMVSLPAGYRLDPSGEPCPRPGELVDVDGERFVAVSIGRSPLPGDSRWCALLMPFPERDG